MATLYSILITISLFTWVAIGVKIYQILNRWFEQMENFDNDNFKR